MHRNGRTDGRITSRVKAVGIHYIQQVPRVGFFFTGNVSDFPKVSYYYDIASASAAASCQLSAAGYQQSTASLANSPATRSLAGWLAGDL